MAKYLLASSPIGGHVAPLRAVGEELVRRGHEVTMITGSRFRADVEGAGLTFVPWPAPADYDDRDLNRSFPRRRGRKGIRAVRFDILELFARPMTSQFETIREELAKGTFKGLVVDLTVGGALVAMLTETHTPPIHVLGCTPLPMASRDTYPFGLGREPPTSVGGALLARVATRLVCSVVLRAARREVDAQLRGLGLAGSPVFFLEWFRLADHFWQLCGPGFEYPRGDLPANVSFAGPVLASLTGELPEWWGDLDGSCPVVLVTQGTVDNDDLSKLIRPTLSALARENVLVVVTTGGPPAPAITAPLPANARVASFIPYDRLLPRVDVMVTNGGFGGVQFAIANRVPSIVAGDGEDKPEVAARVAWSGAGVSLKTGRPSSGMIATSVREVLASAALRASVDKLASEATSLNALGTIADSLEGVTTARSTRGRTTRGEQ